MPKVKKTKLQPWQTAHYPGDGYTKNEPFIQKGESLLIASMRKLTGVEYKLYDLCIWASYHNKKGDGFTLPKASYTRFGIPPSSAAPGLISLEKKGFIKCIYRGRFSREPNVYIFTNEWKIL